ncbi:MAG: hypothetical protein ACYDBY_13520 [Thermoanaerobaculia bacterium]
MRFGRPAPAPLALALLTLVPLSAAAQRAPSSGASRAEAVDSATGTLSEMSKLLASSKEKPERAVKLWDSLAGELAETWRGEAPPVGTRPATALGGDRSWKRPYEAFLAEWTTSGRELLAFRQGLVQRTDGLQTAIDAFPARRGEWTARMNDAAIRMGLGEKALGDASPKPAAVQEALERVVVAKNVAANVAADTQALREQVQREYGKKEAMPAPVTAALARFAKATETHRELPEGWQRLMIDAGLAVKKAFDLNGATRAKYDATYGALVNQQLFEPVARFKGLAFRDLGAPPAKLEADLRALLKRLGERKVTPEDLEREKQRNATECRTRYADLETNNVSTRRALGLAVVRSCGAEACRDAQREAAEGACSTGDIREMSLRLSRWAEKRMEKQAKLRAMLEVDISSGAKSLTTERRLATLAEIESLNEMSTEERELARLIRARQKGTDPACAVTSEAAERACDWDGPECTSARGSLEAEIRSLEERSRAMEKLTRDRERRRKALGLPPDPDWQDCQGR